ncbi:MAG: MmcQ/YjbR family DNA-binding protein [Flavobacteriales bacterium]|nr:MmcQ/YjbR family DNA-binding protein [Flavobacteriales bacterium]
MDAAGARDLLLALPGVTEHAHFDKQAFRGITPKGKASRIFLTLWVDENRAALMLDQELQAELHARNPLVFFPVPNKWGDKGATFVELKACSAALFREVVNAAMRLAGCA